MNAPVRVDVNLSFSLNPSNDAWNGGSILSSLNSFKAIWVTKKNY